jgi:hypothetical protein
MQKEIPFEGYHKNEKLYFNTLVDLSKGDTTQISARFNHLASINPFFDDAIVASSTYFKAHGKNKLNAYNILVNAIQRHPNSVKITKAYCLESARLGFDEYRDFALDRLKAMMPEKSFRQFLERNKAVLIATSN